MKNQKIIKFFLIVIVATFLFCYFVEYTGYYEYNLQNKKNLTLSQIEQFEMDVREGKEIDLNNYLKDRSIDYSNSLTRTTSQANLRLNDYLKRFLTGGLDLLGKFIK